MNNTVDRENDLKALGELKGRFCVKAYQRGYRWTKEHAGLLFEDLERFTEDKSSEDKKNKHYFLQMIVVSRNLEPDFTAKTAGADDRWELIDGQQRLTTALLLDAVLRHKLGGAACTGLEFTITYDTREPSSSLLVSLIKNPDQANTHCPDAIMDEYYLREVCKTFLKLCDGEDEEKLKRLHEALLKRSVVLWYDTGDYDREVNSWDVSRSRRPNSAGRSCSRTKTRIFPNRIFAPICGTRWNGSCAVRILGLFWDTRKAARHIWKFCCSFISSKSRKRKPERPLCSSASMKP